MLLGSQGKNRFDMDQGSRGLDRNTEINNKTWGNFPKSRIPHSKQDHYKRGNSDGSPG